MDKFFLKLGLHRFWPFILLQMLYVGVFLGSCVYHANKILSQDVPAEGFTNHVVLVVYAYMIAFVAVGLLFSAQMRKTVDPSTLAYFDSQLLNALMQEAQTRCTPITWNMVVRIVLQVRDLNIELERKRVQALALSAQKSWYDDRSL